MDVFHRVLRSLVGEDAEKRRRFSAEFRVQKKATRGVGLETRGGTGKN